MSERIAVVGAGAVGGYIGGYLRLHGHDVRVIDAWPEHVETIRRQGLSLSGMTAEESHTIPLEALHVSDVQRLTREPIDIAIIATKSYDTDWATMLIRPYLSATGFVVSAQNSVNEETIASIVGWGRTVGCVVANNFAVDLIAPGHVRRTMPRSLTVPSLYVGEVHGRVTPRVERLRDILSIVDGTAPTTNLWGARWSKLCVNGMRNAPSAATGMSGNERDSHPLVRRVVIRLAGEAIRVGKALGYDLEPITGLQPSRLLDAAKGDPDALSAVEAHMMKGTAGQARSPLQRPSMAQDILKGRRTEIDAINGLIARKANEAGLEAPTHEKLVALVRRIERGQLEPRPENLLDL